MFNALRAAYFYRGVLFVVLCSFTFTYSIPLNANPISTEAAFAMRMENAKVVINTLMQSNKLNDLISFFFVLKADIETYCNVKIDFDEYFTLIQNEFESKGTHISKKDMKLLKIKFKIWEQNIQKKPINTGLNFENDLKLEFDGFNTKVGNGSGSNPSEHIPSQVVFGVTVALCGVALMFVPFSVLGIVSLEAVGWELFAAGTLMAGSKLCDENDSRNHPPPPMHKNHGASLLPYKR